MRKTTLKLHKTAPKNPLRVIPNVSKSWCHQSLSNKSGQIQKTKDRGFSFMTFSDFPFHVAKRVKSYCQKNTLFDKLNTIQNKFLHKILYNLFLRPRWNRKNRNNQGFGTCSRYHGLRFQLFRANGLQILWQHL